VTPIRSLLCHYHLLALSVSRVTCPAICCPLILPLFFGSATSQSDLDEGVWDERGRRVFVGSGAKVTQWMEGGYGVILNGQQYARSFTEENNHLDDTDAVHDHLHDSSPAYSPLQSQYHHPSSLRRDRCSAVQFYIMVLRFYPSLLPLLLVV